MSKVVRNNFKTSVFSKSKEELIATFKPNNSNVLTHLKWMESCNIQHEYGVDATNLSETTVCCSTIAAGAYEYDRIIFCYPFPVSNGKLEERKNLITQFFRSVGEWKGFNNKKGQIILGLKSTVSEEDYQLKEWGVDEIAKSQGWDHVESSKAMIPFWRAIHVNGRRLDPLKIIFDQRSVYIKFYAFSCMEKTSLGDGTEE